MMTDFVCFICQGPPDHHLIGTVHACHKCMKTGPQNKENTTIRAREQ